MGNDEILNRIITSIKTFYGSLDYPNYSKIEESRDSPFYCNFIKELRKGFFVEDVTDLNEDLAVILSVQSKRSDVSVSVRLELSLIDKFVAAFLIEDKKRQYLLTQDNAVADYAAVFDLLSQEGFIVLAKEILETIIPFHSINTESNQSTVYNALFSDVDLLLEQ